MGTRVDAWNKLKWKFIKKRLRYNNEEMAKFRDNPKNEDILDKAPKIQKRKIIAEIL